MSEFPTNEGLLTQAEVDLVDFRESKHGMSREDAVKSVTQDRVGPAALVGREHEIPARNVPGGEIANPNPNKVTAEARKAELEAQLERVADELSAVEDEIKNRVDVPAATSTSGDGFNTNDLDRDGDNQISDDDIRKATVEELVNLVGEYPDLKTRVVALEREKGDGARKTLLAALGEEDAGEEA